MKHKLNLVQRECIKEYLKQIRLALDCIETIACKVEVDANQVPVEIKPDGEMADGK